MSRHQKQAPEQGQGVQCRKRNNNNKKIHSPQRMCLTLMKSYHKARMPVCVCVCVGMENGKPSSSTGRRSGPVLPNVRVLLPVREDVIMRHSMRKKLLSEGFFLRRTRSIPSGCGRICLRIETCFARVTILQYRTMFLFNSCTIVDCITSLLIRVRAL